MPATPADSPDMNEPKPAGSDFSVADPHSAEAVAPTRVFRLPDDQERAAAEAIREISRDGNERREPQNRYQLQNQEVAISHAQEAQLA